MIKRYEREYNDLMEHYKTYENFEAMEKFIKHLLSIVEIFEDNVICVKNVDNENQYKFFKKATNQKWRVSIEYKKQGAEVLEFYVIENVIKHIFDDCNGRYRLSIRVV